MPNIVFTPSEVPLTIGMELELQLIDNETLDLKPSSIEILKRVGPTTKIHAELFQSMLEINSGICNDVHELEKDLAESILRVQDVTAKMGLVIASAGTHPFALYNDRKLFPATRYQDLIDRNQWIARRLMIFGLHIHIGMRDGEHAIQMNNALLHYLPLLLALSASSPFWHGEDTELASSRITFFEALPTGGHPCLVANWQEFEQLYAKLRATEAISSMKDIWWDIRPSPAYGTIEIRICDTLPTLVENTALAALVHALCHYIDKQILSGRAFSPPPYWLLRENKWRASRHGAGAKFILNEEGLMAPLKDVLDDLFGAIADETKLLGYEKRIAFLRTCVEKGLSYERQRDFAKNSQPDHKYQTVVRMLAKEFELNYPIFIR